MLRSAARCSMRIGSSPKVSISAHTSRGSTEARDADNSRGAARGGAPAPRAAGGRAGPRALPALARPRHRCVAPTSRALATLRSSQSSCGHSPARSSRLLGTRAEWVALRRRPTAASSPAQTTHVKVWRDGVCERTIQAHTDDVEGVAMLPGGARFVSVADDGTAKLWTLDGALERTFEISNDYVMEHRGAARRRALCGRLNTTARSGCTTSTARSSTPSRGTWPTTCDGGGGDVRRPAHHQRSLDKPRQGWSVATKSLVSTCAGHTREVAAVAAMPDGQRSVSGSDDYTVRVWLLDGTLKNTFELHTKDIGVRPRGAARQPARALRLVGRDRQALQRQRRRRPAHLQAPHNGGPAWRCCPTAAASSAARGTAPPASSSTASRLSRVNITRL